jgi:hypothetical protein
MFERSILAALVALAAACGDDGGEGENNPHVLTTCDATTGFAGETCEFACATTVDTDDIACNGRAIVDGAEAFVG